MDWRKFLKLIEEFIEAKFNAMDRASDIGDAVRLAEIREGVIKALEDGSLEIVE